MDLLIPAGEESRSRNAELGVNASADGFVPKLGINPDTRLIVGLLAEISTSDQGVAHICVVCDRESRYVATTGDSGAPSLVPRHVNIKCFLEMNKG